MADNYVIAQTRLSIADGESTSIDFLRNNFLRNNLCHISTSPVSEVLSHSSVTSGGKKLGNVFVPTVAG
jgi:hypothetical protein